MKQVEIHIIGIAPLLMHSARLADPTDPIVRDIKKITSKPSRGKNAKTEQDEIELKRLEFMGGIYVDPDNMIIIPGANLEGMIRDGAKSQRKGKATEAGLSVDDAKLIYQGPTDLDKLWQDANFVHRASVVVNKARVMRCRPRFVEWGCKFRVDLFDLDIRPDNLKAWVTHAGSYVGLGDYRPKYGRFEVKGFKS